LYKVVLSYYLCQTAYIILIILFLYRGIARTVEGLQLTFRACLPAGRAGGKPMLVAVLPL
jgi:hypothetical protein